MRPRIPMLRHRGYGRGPALPGPCRRQSGFIASPHEQRLSGGRAEGNPSQIQQRLRGNRRATGNNAAWMCGCDDPLPLVLTLFHL